MTTIASAGNKKSFAALPASSRENFPREGRLSLELGALAAVTSRHVKFGSSEHFGPLLTADSEEADWLVLSSRPLPGTLKLVAVDCEMVQRR